MAVVRHILKLVDEGSQTLNDVARGAGETEAALEGADGAAERAGEHLRLVGKAGEAAGDGLEETAQAAQEADRNLDKAGKSAEAAGAALEGVEGRSGRARDSMRAAGDAAEHMGDRAGRADTIMQGLAGGLELVSPEAAELARHGGDAAGAIEAISFMGSSALSILGPVAVAVGALGLAYMQLAGDVEEAEARMAAANARAQEAQQFSERLGRVRVQASVARGEITEEEGAARLAEMEAAAQFAGQRKELDAEALELAQKRREVEAEIAEIQGYARQTQSTAAAMEAAREQLEKLEGAQAMVQQRVENLNTAQAGLEADLYAIATASKEAAGAENGRAAAIDRASEAQQRAAEAERQRKEKQAAEGAAARDRLLSGQSGPQVTEGGISVIERGQVETQLRTGEAAGGAEVEVPTASGPGAGAIVGQAGAALTGNVAGAVGGPVGMGLSALTAVGGLGADGVDQALDGFKGLLMQGLRSLPEILSEVAPDFAVEMVTTLLAEGPEILYDIIEGALLGVWNLIKGFFVELFKVGDGDGRTGIDGRDEGFLEDTAESILLAMDRVGGGMVAGLARRHSGGLADREQLAILQAGEIVVPENGAMTSNARAQAWAASGGAGGSAAGGGVHFYDCNFAGPSSVDWIRQQMLDIYGPGGLSNAPTPWGS